MSDASMRLSDYDTGTRFQATVVSSERITPATSEVEVRELVLDVDRPDFEFTLGQSIGVVAPADPGFGHAHHFRLYSVADLPERGSAGKPRIRICVRRCSYIDEYSGESFKGVASNFLCDLEPGASFPITGPFGAPFAVPEENDANLILIGSGTGIAPFRALVKHLYKNVSNWKGKVWLFYGAKSSLELLYQNEEKNDFAKYYDEDTFEAFNAFSPRPHWADPIGWDYAITERGEELWRMLQESNTYIYLAGMEKMRDDLEARLAGFAGSREKLDRRKAEMMAGRRWLELLY